MYSNYFSLLADTANNPNPNRKYNLGELTDMYLLTLTINLTLSL